MKFVDDVFFFGFVSVDVIKIYYGKVSVYLFVVVFVFLYIFVSKLEL